MAPSVTRIRINPDENEKILRFLPDDAHTMDFILKHVCMLLGLDHREHAFCGADGDLLTGDYGRSLQYWQRWILTPNAPLVLAVLDRERGMFAPTRIRRR